MRTLPKGLAAKLQRLTDRGKRQDRRARSGSPAGATSSTPAAKEKPSRSGPPDNATQIAAHKKVRAEMKARRKARRLELEQDRRRQSGSPAGATRFLALVRQLRKGGG